LSAQQTGATLALPVGGGPQIRASDADRDAAAGLLGAAFAEGRLTAEEHGERVSAAYAARTVAQLQQLTEDLPAAPGTRTRRTARTGMFAEPDLCLLCLLLIVCPPAGIAWWLLARRRPAADLEEVQLTPGSGPAAGDGLEPLGATQTGRRAVPRESPYAQDR